MLFSTAAIICVAEKRKCTWHESAEPSGTHLSEDGFFDPNARALCDIVVYSERDNRPPRQRRDRKTRHFSEAKAVVCKSWGVNFSSRICSKLLM